MSLIDVKKVQEEAEAELREEAEKKAKTKIKSKIKEIQAAEVIVANLKRDLEDLYATIGEGNE
jgi:hypothetical protein